MAEVLFKPFEKTAPLTGIENVLQLARRIDLPLQSTCGGKKICGKCRIIVEKSQGALPPPSDRECQLLGALVEQGYRLACETVLPDGAVVRIPEESLLRRQVILTSDTDHPYAARLRPKTELYYLEVSEPTIESLKADRERLISALQETYGIRTPYADPMVLHKLPGILRSGQEGVTAVVREKKEIIDLYAGEREKLFGMAFDVGTTTIVGYLLDLLTGDKVSVKSDMNPQIAFGDDVISRISFCQEDRKGLEKLQSGVAECLNRLITEAASEARIDAAQIVEMTLVGNTAMHHLFLGLDPRYLSMAPYPPVLTQAQDFKARDLGIDIGPSAYVHLLPLKAGFVGSDAIACVLATGIHRRKGVSLLIDLGTNGEIVLGNKDRLFCCSTAAGPAFEGGHIKFGMRASSGAIERVRIGRETLDVTVKTIDDHPPMGLCGSGTISAVAEMIRTGIVLQRGNFNDTLQSVRLREGEDGFEFVLVWAADTAHEKDIVITQKDVAELQMAKSAVHAGATLLMSFFEGIQIREVLLAGACGNYVDPLDACTIDLFPGCETGRVTGVGNAAGHGACLALLDKTKRKEAEGIARRAQYQELAASDRFQDLFVSGMFFTSARDYEGKF